MNIKSFFNIMGGCSCPTGYTLSETSGLCEKVETISPNITHSNYCVASSKRNEYSSLKARIYNAGFSNSSISSTFTPTGETYAELTGVGQWINLPYKTIDPDSSNVDTATDTITIMSHGFYDGMHVQYINGGTEIGGLVDEAEYIISLIDVNSFKLKYVSTGIVVDITSTGTGTFHEFAPLTGAMNRAGVWIDSNCNGTKDSLTSGQKITISYQYTNTGAERTIYVGIGGDNQFNLKVNTSDVATTLSTSNTNNFYIWHIFPVTLIQGVNNFNLVGTGDGSVNDSIAMTIYDNTAAQIAAASGDNNAGLNILFSSESLTGSHIDVATCDAGYELDTSGGQGNYICTRTLKTSCS